MLRRYLKYGIAGGVTLCSAATLRTLHNHDYDAGSLGVVRAGRAAAAVADVARIYKRKLYARKLDKDSEAYHRLKSEVHTMAADRLLKMCLANKGVFIKVGQHIGALDYLLPNEYVHTMRILHKDAPANSVEAIYKVIREDLKTEPDRLFDSFEPEPLGTASLAQVHKAKLKTGRTVAVKVQHYFVRKNVNTDIKTMEYLIKAMSWLFPDFQMQWLVDEIKSNIYKELDFKEEGRNAEKLAEIFKDYSWLKIPQIFWEYTTERILVMEFVEGGQVNDFEYVKAHKIDPYDLSRKLGNLYSHMIFVHGFVHSDPHPGNILIKKEPKEKEVTVYLLDHGLYAKLSDRFRYDYAQLWLSIINRDHANMKKYAKNLGVKKELYGVFACIVSGRPWESIMSGISSVKPGHEEKKLFQAHIPNFLMKISYCLQNMDRQMLLVLKSNDLIRSIEYALGTQQSMCGFSVMTRCCIKSVNVKHMKDSKTLYDKTLVKIQNCYMMIVYYAFVIFTEFKIRFIL